MATVTWTLGGFLTGLSTGVACVGVCGAVLLPVLLAERRTTMVNVGVVGWFCVGRLGAYVTVGALVGWVGSVLQGQGWFGWLQVIGYGVAGVVLLGYLAQRSGECRVECKARWAHVSLVLGLLSGLNVCPPFISAIAVVLGSGSVWRGVGYFVAFFVGTSVFLVPLVVAGWLARWGGWQRLGRVGGALVGFAYVYLALSGIHRGLHGAELAEGGQSSLTEAVGITGVSEEVRRIFPEARELRDVGERGVVMQVLSNGTIIGYAVDTRRLGITEMGYAGPTPVVVGVTTQGVVRGVEILPNAETPRFLARVRQSGWWQGLVGLRLHKLREYLEQPAAVSGATMSAEALRAQMRGAAEALEESMGVCEKEKEAKVGGLTVQRGAWARIWGWLPAAVVCVGAVLVGSMRVLQRAYVRWALWIMSIGLLGFYRANYFSFSQVSTAMQGAWPGVEAIGWHLMFWFAVLSPLFFGRVYCQYVCPFGVASEVLHRLIPWKMTLPVWIGRWLKYGKYVVLGAGVWWLLWEVGAPVERLEPFHALFIRPQPRAYVVFGVTALTVSVLVKRFWCAFFCLDGALFELISKYRWKRVQGEGI